MRKRATHDFCMEQNIRHIKEKYMMLLKFNLLLIGYNMIWYIQWKIVVLEYIIILN